ncbi:hypothetical protein niasHS_001482 [Heterodera schachtii]|uniref:HIG1 domain-containing protein n=1 Tax=Heterodera schachtii TaxID=97005 RepID=A0ABD2KDW7_HETSC
MSATAAVPMAQHFRLFCHQTPPSVNSDGSEAKRRQINEPPKEGSGRAPSLSIDPFSWEPTKWERFFLVLTRCYARSADIPAIIPLRVGKQYTKRMRLLRFSFALLIAIVVSFGAEFYMASWDRRMRRGQLSDDDVKFLEKMRDKPMASSWRYFRHFFATSNARASRRPFFAALAAGATAAKVPKSAEGSSSEELLPTDGETTAEQTKKGERELTAREKRFDKTKHGVPDFRHVAVTDQIQTKRSVWQVPVAPLGIVATVAALLYMLHSSYRGNRNALLQSMQYRIMAQLFTVVSLVVGTMYLSSKDSAK